MGDKYEASFFKLKEKLTIALILTLLIGVEGFEVLSDALLHGLGCILMQYGKVVANASRQFEHNEMKYSTHDLELVVVVFALKLWWYYIYGVQFVIYTNHKSLQYFVMQLELNMRERKWMD